MDVTSESEPNSLLPLTVKELEKCSKKGRKHVSHKHRPRRLSSIHSLRSQAYPPIIQKSKSAGISSGTSSTRTFFPSTLSSTKEQASTSKMDNFVPSPSFMSMSAYLATSPHSSIYDHERSDPTLCGIYAPFSNPSVDSAISDDISGLDDKLEDSSLQNILTSEVLTTLQAPAMDTPSEFTWSGKLDPDASLPSDVDSLGPNPTLAQLNMEPDMSLLNNMLSLDPEDNKLSYSALDFLCNDVSSSSSIPCASTKSLESSATEPKMIYETLGCTNGKMGDSEKIAGSAENSYIRNFSNLKNSFPPRSSQPQKIGVVMPVKKPEIKQEEGLGKPQVQSPSLHKLLSKPVVKSEICNSAPFVQSDMKPQIVPSSGPAKRTYTELVKQEPLSPKGSRRPLVKDESTEEKWKDIENFIHNPADEPQLKKRRRYNSGSSGHMSDDDDDDDDGASSYEGKGGYEDSDDDYSDIDEDITHIVAKDCESLIGMGKKQKQYFWQYNVQSKGPKGTRLKLAVDAPADPHVLNDFEDPVFDECNTSIAGIRHGGKARKGDGNEITPNPRKLFMIGHQLMKLNRQINACQLGADVPAAKRNESRKEKNKLASKACRLKKKAQHEANKIKLYGLEQEHSQLNPVLQAIWPHIRERARAILGQTDKNTPVTPSDTSLTSKLESLISQNLKEGMVAGHTTDYVNNVILKVESGDNSGGLSIKKSRKT